MWEQKCLTVPYKVETSDLPVFIDERGMSSQLQKHTLGNNNIRNDTTCGTTVRWGIDDRLSESQNQRHFQKTVRELERSLSENANLRAQMKPSKSNFEMRKEESRNYETEISTLRLELEMNRRIVHTKRNIIQKEITDEMKERFRLEIRNEITEDITKKTTREVEIKVRQESEDKMRCLHDQLKKSLDDSMFLQEKLEASDGNIEKLWQMGKSIPILENEIAGLHRTIYSTEDNYAIALLELKEEYQRSLETMKQKFSTKREREERDLIQRIKALSEKNERQIQHAKTEKEEYGTQVMEEVTQELEGEMQLLVEEIAELTVCNQDLIVIMEKEKECAKTEKNELGTQIREEVTQELQGKMQVLVEKVAELTADNQDMLETMEEEKEIQSELICQQMTKERDDLLAEAAKEKEFYVEKIRQEMTEERKLEVGYINGQVSDLTNEKDSLLKIVNELEQKLSIIQEKHTKNVGKLNKSESALKTSNNENFKLKKNKRHLITLTDKYRKDYTDALNEVNKIKGHFKYAFLVESEEKIIALEGEVRNLESIVQQSGKNDPKNVETISNQVSLLKGNESNTRESEEKILELSDNVQHLESIIEQSEKEISKKSTVLEEYETIGKSRDAEIKKHTQCLRTSMSELQTSKSELLKCKRVISQTEAENLQLNQDLEELRTLFGDCEMELTEIRYKFEASKKEYIALQEYDEKITLLNQEIVEYKSKQENCHCESSPRKQTMNDSKQFKNSDHLQGRVERLHLLLKVSEKNHDMEKKGFEKSKEYFNLRLIACKDEIECLHLDVARLKNALYQSSKDLKEEKVKEDEGLQVVQTEKKDFRSKLVNMEVDNLELKERSMYSKQLLRETVVESEKTLSKNSMLETLSIEREELINKIGFLEKTIYEAIEDHKKEKYEYEKLIQDLKDELNSFNVKHLKVEKKLQNSKVLLKDVIFSKQSETESLNQQHNQHRDPNHINTNVSDFQDPHNKEKLIPKFSTKMMESDAVRDSLAIEMTIDAHNSHQISEETSTFNDNLRSFKYDYDRYIDDFTTTIITTTTKNNSDGKGNNKDVRDDPESRINPPPQPHQDDDNDEEKVQRMRERSFSLTGKNPQTESRDDNASTIRHQSSNNNFKSRNSFVFPSIMSTTSDSHEHIEDCRGHDDNHGNNRLRHPEMLRLEEIDSLKEKNHRYGRRYLNKTRDNRQ